MDNAAQLLRIFQANIDRFYVRVIATTLNGLQTHASLESGVTSDLNLFLDRCAAQVDNHTANEAAKAFALTLDGVFERQLARWTKALGLLPKCAVDALAANCRNLPPLCGRALHSTIETLRPGRLPTVKCFVSASASLAGMPRRSFASGAMPILCPARPRRGTAGINLHSRNSDESAQLSKPAKREAPIELFCRKESQNASSALRTTLTNACWPSVRFIKFCG